MKREKNHSRMREGKEGKWFVKDTKRKLVEPKYRKS